MPGEYARRFAVVLVKSNGHLGRFEVDVLDRDFALDLMQEFHALGCTSTISDHSAVLTIQCPQSVFEGIEAGTH